MNNGTRQTNSSQNSIQQVTMRRAKNAYCLMDGVIGYTPHKTYIFIKDQNTSEKEFVTKILDKHYGEIVWEILRNCNDLLPFYDEPDEQVEMPELAVEWVEDESLNIGMFNLSGEEISNLKKEIGKKTSFEAAHCGTSTYVCKRCNTDVKFKWVWLETEYPSGHGFSCECGNIDYSYDLDSYEHYKEIQGEEDYYSWENIHDKLCNSKDVYNYCSCKCKTDTLRIWHRDPQEFRCQLAYTLIDFAPIKKFLYTQDGMNLILRCALSEAGEVYYV